MFEMLLGLRVFRDAKGALRYAIGVQYEVCSARIASRHTRDLALLYYLYSRAWHPHQVTSPSMLKAVVPKLAKLLKLFPPLIVEEA